MPWEPRPGPRRGGSGGFDKLPDFDFSRFKSFSFEPGRILWIIPILLLLWLATGFYKVELQEQAVVLVVGKHNNTTEPGLHWNLPTPFGRVVKVSTEEIKRVEIGFRSGMSDVGKPDLIKEAQMLTEGENIIDVHMSVQYKVKDSAAFLFNVADAYRSLSDRGLQDTVRGVGEASLREVVGRNNVDAVLTFDRNRIQVEILAQMQDVLDRYGAGITIQAVQLQDVFPPDEVREAFRDVTNANEDKNRLIREAEGYNNSIIPETRGRAAQIIAAAEAYREERVKSSEGDARRFLSQLEEYRKAPGVTRKRLYLETMEQVLASVDKVIVDERIAKSVLPLLPLGGRQVEVTRPKEEAGR